jgi:hypothetical protein
MRVALLVPYVYGYIRNCAEDKQKSLMIMKIEMYAILDKANPHTENTRSLNLAGVTCTFVQLSILPWQRETTNSSSTK